MTQPSPEHELQYVKSCQYLMLEVFRQPATEVCKSGHVLNILSQLRRQTL